MARIDDAICDIGRELLAGDLPARKEAFLQDAHAALWRAYSAIQASVAHDDTKAVQVAGLIMERHEGVMEREPLEKVDCAPTWWRDGLIPRD